MSYRHLHASKLSPIFKTIESSVDSSRKSITLFNKDWNTYKANWQNASGFGNKVGSLFSSATSSVISNEQVSILRNWNNAVKHGCIGQETFNKIIENADDNTKIYFSSLNKGKASLDGLKNAQNMAKTSTIGLTVATTVLNLAISFGFVAAISLAAKGISKLINYQDDLINKMNESISKFEEQRTSLSSNKETIDEISSDYEKLSQGVDNLGRNVSLNGDEYAKYNEIVNRIAEMFPQMIQGYTDEGNAIIANKGNVEALTKAYKEQKQAYQDSIITQSAKTFSGYKAKVTETTWQEELKGKNGTYALAEQKKYIDELIVSINNGEDAFEKFYSNVIGNSDIYNVLHSATKQAGFEWGGILSIDDRYKNAKNTKNRDALESYSNVLQNQIDQATAKIKPIMQVYLERSFQYQRLDTSVQDVVTQIVSQFDSEFYQQFENESDMSKWITENIVNKFKGVTGDEIANTFSSLLNLKT